MKIIKKHQAHKFKNNDKCIALEYPLESNDINGAVIELTGRYPGKGRVVNLECKELVYIIGGSGKLVVEEVETGLEQGDSVLIETGEKYFFDGNLTMFMSCTPAWFPEQHKEVE